MIYFIRSGISGPIKIGYTDNGIHTRLMTLQTGSWEQLMLVHSMKGGEKLEKKLHKQFEEYRIRGEWFWPSERLLTYIYGSPVGSPDTRHKVSEGLSTTIESEIRQVLHQVKNNKFKAAKQLKISRSTLYAKMKRYGITA